jgi:hypothetical protein
MISRRSSRTDRKIVTQIVLLTIQLSSYFFGVLLKSSKLLSRFFLSRYERQSKLHSVQLELIEADSCFLFKMPTTRRGAATNAFAATPLRFQPASRTRRAPPPPPADVPRIEYSSAEVKDVDIVVPGERYRVWETIHRNTYQLRVTSRGIGQTVEMAEPLSEDERNIFRPIPVPMPLHEQRLLLAVYSNKDRQVVHSIDFAQTSCVLSVVVYSDAYTIEVEMGKKGVPEQIWSFKLSTNGPDQVRSATTLWNHLCRSFNVSIHSSTTLPINKYFSTFLSLQFLT